MIRQAGCSCLLEQTGKNQRPKGQEVPARQAWTGKLRSRGSSGGEPVPAAIIPKLDVHSYRAFFRFFQLLARTKEFKVHLRRRNPPCQ